MYTEYYSVLLIKKINKNNDIQTRDYLIIKVVILYQKINLT
jgi:hypothetical protein